MRITDMNMDLSNVDLSKTKKSIWCTIKNYVLNIF